MKKIVVGFALIIGSGIIFAACGGNEPIDSLAGGQAESEHESELVSIDSSTELDSKIDLESPLEFVLDSEPVTQSPHVEQNAGIIAAARAEAEKEIPIEAESEPSAQSSHVEQNAEIAAAAKAEAEAKAKEKDEVEASKAVSSSGTAGSGSDVSGSPGTGEEDWPVLGGWVFKPGDPNSPDPYEQPGSQSNLSGSFVGMDEPTYSTPGGDLVKKNLRAFDGTAVWSKKYGGWIETSSSGRQTVRLPDGDGFYL